MQKSLLLLALLCASTACRSTDEPAASPPAGAHSAEPKAQAVAALPIVPAKKADEKAAPKEDVYLAVPALPAAKPAEEPKAAAPVGTRAERFEALQKEFDEAMNAYYDLFRNAKSEAEMQAVAKTAKAPDTAPFFARANALLDEDPTDATAFSALQWMFDNSRDEKQTERLCAIVEKHHFAKAEVAELLRPLAYSGSAGNQLIERLSKESPHEAVRGRALFQCATSAMEDVRFAAEVKSMADGPEKDSYKGYLGEERFARLMLLDAAQAEKDALALFQRVQKEYGSVKLHVGTPYESTLGEQSGANIFEIENLAVGKTAPEIEGEDVAGVAFKLSDYRGKVVMLDFWGFW
ncbi:MAG: hypothetical protein IPJ77_06515 [Planctomycetes bacterium]|nr:hypothetical protein [Planctomycetota bacterium]